MKLGGIVRVKYIKEKGKKLLTPKKKISYKKLLLYTFGAVILFTVLLFLWYYKDLPTPAKLAKIRAAESTQILDRNGNILYETGDERRTVITKEQMPDNVRNATVAVEDANFYKHGGVDFRGILRAAAADILHLRVSQGGSTITQQFIKNAVLSPQRTISRKIKEVILALELEQVYSKDEILTMYLNEIPYGGNIYGVEQASQSYFGKPAKDLTLSEASTLAAIPQAPTYFSPYGTHTDKLFSRKNYVLDRMAGNGYINTDQAEKAKLEAPNKDKFEFKRKREMITAPHFVMYVREKLVDLYGERLVNSGGLKVTTTLDMDKQKKAEEAIYTNEKQYTAYGATNAALVSVDTKSGEILAMVGGKDYFDVEHGGNVNVTDSARQPGSSFKPVVYATAFKQNRFSPAFTLFDLTTDFNGYKPSNYDGNTHGPVSMRTALANSLNIPAVKTLALVGLPEALKTAKDLGITTLNQPERYGLSLVLGGGEVKPVEMAGAFAAFADGGSFHRPVSILKVEDHSKKTLYQYDKESNKYQALDPQIAYQITDILDDDKARCMIFGCNNPMNFGDYHVAAKTGTTQEFHDAWTNGYSTKIATSVWVGNNDNTKMRSGADGSIVAAPIFHDYMANFADDSQFQRPAGIEEVTVEKYSGKLPTSLSRETVKDLFASWQIPTEKDDINIIRKVNKTNNKIATDSTPPELIEEKIFTNLHNEWGDKWKDYPSWEAPIRSWAGSHGMDLIPPYEKDDSYSHRPDISITSPSNNQAVNGSISIRVSVSSEQGVDEVSYYLDDTNIGHSNSSPYGIDFDTNHFSNGSHRLTARLRDPNGVNGEASIQINIQNSSRPNIYSVSVDSITGNSATVKFNTDVSADSTVYYGLSSGDLSSSKGAGGGTIHSAGLTGLQSGKKYYFKIVAKNGESEGTYEGDFTTS